jgi:hypothetical protein
MPIYGAIGNFEKHVHVLAWDDGKGYVRLYCILHIPFGVLGIGICLI